MPFTFAQIDKKYIIKKIKGNEEVNNFLKKLGLVEGKHIKSIATDGSGCIAMVNDTKVAIDRSLANKIIVGEI